jgi:hypothetical protein
VVAQSLRAGAIVGFRTPLRLVLGAKPPAPKSCRAPRFVRVLANSRELVAWKDPIREADNADRRGEGAQRAFACVPGHSRKYLFFTEENELLYYAALEGLHAAGHMLAFTSSWADHYNSGSEDLVVFDAARGKRTFIHSYPFSEGSGRATFASFALSSNGDVAWVAQEVLFATKEGKLERSGERDTLEVHERTGTHLLETTSTPPQLRVLGHVLEWESSGQRHSRLLR